jgi:hypothetical protein
MAAGVSRRRRRAGHTFVQWIPACASAAIDGSRERENDVNALAMETIDAHGGLGRWRQFEHASARLRNGGVLWALKGQQGVIDDVRVRVALRREWASHAPASQPWRTSFEPHHVAIETAGGRVVEARASPRDSFAGHALTTPWDRLQLAYFAGYAMWTYLTAPFLFAMDGVDAVEIEPWREDGEVWRRLQVSFPGTIATHGPIQTFHVGPDGLLRRHDYDAEVLGGTPAAHYLHDYAAFDGIQVPTRRRVYGRSADGAPALEPLVVSIDLSDVEFT